VTYNSLIVIYALTVTVKEHLGGGRYGEGEYNRYYV